MSKIIRITPEYMEECRKDFEEALSKNKFVDGKINFTKTLPAPEYKKATLYYTVEAWMKMATLLDTFNKEVAWHGVAHRLDTEGANEYIITDILVYPQTVTGTTVEMDTVEYANWIQENEEDERFYNIHMQGHSHVNMSPSPSGVDITHQEEIVAQLRDDDFYIFVIYNKSMKRNIKIFDMKKNTLFEDYDIDVKFAGLDEFVADAKSMVKDRVYTYKTPTYQPPAVSGQPYNPLGNSNSQPAKTETDGKGNNEGKSNKNEEKPKTQIGAGWKGANASRQQSMFDEEDDPYGYYRAHYGE